MISKRALAKVETSILPLFTVLVFCVSPFLGDGIYFHGVHLLLFLAALALFIHGAWVLKKEETKLYRVSLVFAAAWIGLSFLPIWFGHFGFSAVGDVAMHHHTFWELPHIH